MFRKEKKGFTLIELLVVIAIIALLLAILMPGLKKVKQLAGGLVCRTQMRDIGLMMQFYMNDHDGRMVSNQYAASAGGTGRWQVRLGEYYNRHKSSEAGSHNRYNTDIFYCPIEWKKRIKNGSGAVNSGNSANPQAPHHHHHYQLNGFVIDAGKDNERYVLRSRFANNSTWRNAQTLPLLHDSNSDVTPINQNIWAQMYPAANLVEYGWEGGAKLDKTYRFGPAANHGAGINYLFGDLHVEMTLWPYKGTMKNPKDKGYYHKLWHPRGDLDVKVHTRIDY